MLDPPHLQPHHSCCFCSDAANAACFMLQDAWPNYELRGSSRHVPPHSTTVKPCL